MKGIVLSGGHGTRLSPMTRVVSKHLLPVYDKPMIYYPLSVLMLAGIREILVISTPRDLPLYEELLKDGKHLGCTFTYAAQQKPSGLPEAFIIGARFIGEEPVALILGDNFFHGPGIAEMLQHCTKPDGCIVFSHRVENPEEFAVIEFDDEGNVVSITEKPRRPSSKLVIPGIYFFDSSVKSLVLKLIPGARGELEISTLINLYLSENKLQVRPIARGSKWMDTGTVDGMLEASNFVRNLESRKGKHVGVIEEVAYRMGFIDQAQLRKLAENNLRPDYKDYLLKICE